MKSQAIVCVLAVLCSALSVNSSPAAQYIQSKADQSLMKYLMKPRAGSSDAANSLACFDYYLPILNGIAEDYQKNYEACLDTESAAKAALQAEGNDVRQNITSISNDVCTLFANCQAIDDNLDFFACYTNLGDQSVRDVYTVSQDAAETAAYLQEQYRVIQATCDKCTNETQRIFVTDTADAYDELDLCFTNGLKTTAAPTTTEAAVTTTEESTTTTEAQSTTPEETTKEDSTSTTEAVTTSVEASSTEEASSTTTEETGTETPEKDPVEELKLTENTARNRLETFVRNWNKRLA